MRLSVSTFLALSLFSPLATAQVLDQEERSTAPETVVPETATPEVTAPTPTPTPTSLPPTPPAPQPATPTKPARPIQPPRGGTQQTLLQTAETQYANGEFDAALETLETLLNRQQSKPADQAETYNLIGLVQDRRDRFTEASTAYQRALQLYQALGSQGWDETAMQGEAKTLNNLGTLYAAEERIPEALGFLDRSLGLSRQLKSRENEAITLRNLGNLYLQVDRFPEAIKALEDSLAIEIELKRPNPIVSILDRLSSLYDAAGVLPKAIVATEEALKIVEPTNDNDSKLLLLDRLAGLYDSAGSPSQAIETYNKMLGLLQRLGNQVLAGRLRNRMAGLYEELGQTDQALQEYQAVLAIAQTGDDILSQARILTSIGDLYRETQQWENSKNHYRQALALVEPLTDETASAKPIAQGRLYSALAAIAKEQRQWDNALELAQQALQAQSRPLADPEQQAQLRVSKAVSLNLIGDIYDEQGKPSQATQAYRQSLSELGQQGNPLLQGANLSGLGRVLMQLNRPGEAIAPLEDAVRIWEAVGLEAAQGGDRDLVDDSYRLLVDAQLAQDNTNQALVVVEQRRSRLLRTFLELRQPNQAEPIPPLSLAQMQQQARQQQATFIIYDLAQAVTPGSRPATEPATQQSTQLVDKTLRIWAVSPAGEVTFKQVPLEQSLATIVTTAQNQNDLKALSKLLVEPVKSSLPKDVNTTIVVVPSPELSTVPFAALPTSEGKVMLERYSLVTLPSIHLLARPQADKATGESVSALVVGDPAMPNVRRRPEVEAGTKAVAALLEADPLVGAEATLDAIAPLISKAKTIHLAVPQLQIAETNEALAFASTQGIEGITPGDILSLKLQANLVTIQGLIAQADRQGNKTFALPQAFLAAGVPTVITSTSEGSDAAAQLLMTELYQRLKNSPGLSPNQALRQAMLQVRKQYPSPKDWASFVVMGQ